MDFIGRFERLDYDFDRLVDALGIGITPLQHLNGSIWPHGDFRAFYTPTACEYVKTRYADDLERWGYLG